MLERDYKDTEVYLYVSAGRWQCFGSPIKEEDRWLQAVVFVQAEEWCIHYSQKIIDLRVVAVFFLKNLL